MEIHNIPIDRIAKVYLQKNTFNEKVGNVALLVRRKRELPFKIHHLAFNGYELELPTLQQIENAKEVTQLIRNLIKKL